MQEAVHSGSGDQWHSRTRVSVPEWRSLAESPHPTQDFDTWPASPAPPPSALMGQHVSPPSPLRNSAVAARIVILGLFFLAYPMTYGVIRVA